MKTAYSSIALSFFAVSMLALTGCGAIRVVQRTPTGGVVALEGDQDKAREKAAEYMASQCPEGYQVVEEGETVVGQEMREESRREKVFGVPVKETRSETTDKREWRMKYQCNGANRQAGIQEVIVTF